MCFQKLVLSETIFKLWEISSEIKARVIESELNDVTQDIRFFFYLLIDGIKDRLCFFLFCVLIDNEPLMGLLFPPGKFTKDENDFYTEKSVKG